MYDFLQPGNSGSSSYSFLEANRDGSLYNIAQQFLRDDYDPTPGSESLDPADFDYSVDSLSNVDAYIDRMRTVDMSDDDRSRFLLRCGAYVGEVFRQNTPAERAWHWIDHAAAARLNPLMARSPQTTCDNEILWDGKSGFAFPIKIVEKCLENGSAESGTKPAVEAMLTL